MKFNPTTVRMLAETIDSEIYGQKPIENNVKLELACKEAQTLLGILTDFAGFLEAGGVMLSASKVYRVSAYHTKDSSVESYYESELAADLHANLLLEEGLTDGRATVDTFELHKSEEAYFKLIKVNVTKGKPDVSQFVETIKKKLTAYELKILTDHFKNKL